MERSEAPVRHPGRRPPASLTPDGEDPGPPAPLPQGMSSIHPAGSGAEGFHPWSVFWFTSLMLSHLPGEP